MSDKSILTEIGKDHIQNLIEKDKRKDGRDFEEMRDLKIEVDTAGNAEGSATVTLGKTRVMAGVKMEVGEPFPDTPDAGVLRVNAEFNPIASPNFETGRPGPEAVELSRVVDRGVRESEAIDLEKLCIEEEEKVWMVSVDVDVINHDGNLLDASGIAVIAALLNTKVPKIDEDYQIDREEFEMDLPVREIPVPCTIVKIKDKLLLDPSIGESETLDARLTVTTMENNKYCSLQKGGNKGMNLEEIEKALDISMEKGKELREKIKKASSKKQ
ncbi:MAG: exosome complex protein Rrp42 [Candidatus Aenigmatarchaeota archaeon]